MHKLCHKPPAWVWQMLLLGLQGLSGIVFVPILLRWTNPQLMANVLVTQVYVYYLVVLVQYGFVFSGPAAVARAASAAGVAQVWSNSVRSKLLLLVGPVALVFGCGYAFMALGQSYVVLFAILLSAYALNSNWWLQAQQRFAPAVGFAALGVVGSGFVVYALVEGHVGATTATQGAWVVLALTLPQVSVGVGSWWVARQACVALMVASTDRRGLSDCLDWLRTDAPLVTCQLLLLASSTVGTVVVGGLTDSRAAVAYAATEKLFNLAATVLVGLYMAFYPRLANLFYKNRELYWRTTQLLLMVCVSGGLVLAALLAYVGPMLLGWYLPLHMGVLLIPALSPLGLWLGLCISQHVLTSYLVLAERTHMVLWVNMCVLIVTVLVGYVCALRTPVTWVYGMVAGQMLALVWLQYLCRQDRVIGV